MGLADTDVHNFKIQVIDHVDQRVERSLWREHWAEVWEVEISIHNIQF